MGGGALRNEARFSKFAFGRRLKKRKLAVVAALVCFLAIVVPAFAYTTNQYYSNYWAGGTVGGTTSGTAIRVFNESSQTSGGNLTNCVRYLGYNWYCGTNYYSEGATTSNVYASCQMTWLSGGVFAGGECTTTIPDH